MFRDIFLRPGRLALAAVTEVLFPESCVVCGARPHLVPWCRPGPVIRGLRPWDRPHLCRRCMLGLGREGPVAVTLGEGSEGRLEYRAACPVTSDLAAVVGWWKYHGVRGLGWPLANLAAGALPGFTGDVAGNAVLVPVPLHGRRRRSRGFNQAAVLARLLGRDLGIPVVEHAARRVQSTGQQARLIGAAARRANTAGCFRARSPDADLPARALIVDDVVTSGATTAELAGTLTRAGWQVTGVLAVGLAPGRV